MLVRMLGSTWRRMMRRCPAPRQRIPSMYISPLTLMTSPRTRREKPTQEVMTRARMMLWAPRSITPTRAIIRMVPGRPWNTLEMQVITASTAPPQ